MTTAYAYDPIEQAHNQTGHVENNRRTAAIMARLQEYNLLEHLTPTAIHPLGYESLRRVHKASYIDYVQRFAKEGGGMLDFETYMTPDSYEVALMSAGAATGITRAVVSGKVDNGMSIMRPPGHHALPDQAMGFCIFANAALTARAAQVEMGLERVLIIDWDVHHGNGTEAIFYDDPTVAFISLHQHPLWPGTGMVEDVGVGPGRGYTMNIPMPPYTGASGYLQAFDELIVPFARRFQPQLILVSSGYDVHWRDPLSQMNMTAKGYGQLTLRVRRLATELCDGRVAILLEGGYDLSAVSYGVLNTILSLMGREDDFVDPLGESSIPETDVTDLITKLKRIHGLSP